MSRGFVVTLNANTLEALASHGNNGAEILVRAWDTGEVDADVRYPGGVWTPVALAGGTVTEVEV